MPLPPHSYCAINVSIFFLFRKEEVTNTGLPPWLLELVPAIKFDINNVSNWRQCDNQKLHSMRVVRLSCNVPESPGPIFTSPVATC